ALRRREHLHFATLIVEHQGVELAHEIHADDHRGLMVEIPQMEDVEASEHDAEVDGVHIAYLYGNDRPALTGLYVEGLATHFDRGVGHPRVRWILQRGIELRVA